MNDSTSLSRATSISKTSRRSSTASRNASLIKKNIAPHDLEPSDILIERFVAWKTIVKQLIAYFEGIAEIENNLANQYTKLGAVIQVPFRAGNQFLGEGGLQDVYYSIRDKTRIIADHHANLGRTIDSSIVQHLQKLRVEVKAHVKNIQNDTGKLATNVAKERAVSARLIAELSSAVTTFKNTPMNVTTKLDPYVANTAVIRQLNKQVHEENLLQKSIIIIQQNSAHFEEGIVRAIQSAWQTYDEWQSRMSSSVQEVHRTMATQMGALAPDREWISFSARSDHLLDPETPLRNVDHIKYPMKDEPSLIPVHVGMMERKKRFMRSYKESFFVLTPAGFLHEFQTSDPHLTSGQTPSFSVFLPACTLGPPSTTWSKSHKFHIEGRKDGTGATKGGSFKAPLKGGNQGWTFRARSREEMMEWWNDIRMLSARYLVASEQMERSGPVAAAVRAAGYNSEDEEDEEEGGSSAEDEEEEPQSYEPAQVHEDDAHPPNYSHVEKADGVEANGYTDEKKPIPPNDDDEAGVNISRRPSKRQMEKAPEGKQPRADQDEEATADSSGGPAPVESRFTENL